MRDEFLDALNKAFKPMGPRNINMGVVLGEPRSNRPFPAVERGIDDGIDLPVVFTTPFKWFSFEPKALDSLQNADQSAALCLVQIEGGPGSFDPADEVFCRNALILLVQDIDGIWREQASLQIAPFDGNFVSYVESWDVDQHAGLVHLVIKQGGRTSLWTTNLTLQITETGIVKV